jgi:alpha-amylase
MDVCLYFQVHQPKRLRHYTFFDIGNAHDYEDCEKNRNILLKVAHKCYLPTNALLYKLIKQHQGAFKIAFSITGMVIEQFKEYCPEVLDSFRKLIDTGCVEILNETYNHSLSFIFSKDSFIEEVKLHQALIKNEFGQIATTFRNTELIYNNDIAATVASLGYKTMLAEGVEKVLGWRNANYVYTAHGTPQLKLLLRNYKLTDDIAFRFSDRSWAGYPLTADKFAHWVHSLDGQGDVLNLFMDYETFGEHQWEDTGIFEFLNAFPDALLRHPNFRFNTPRDVAANYTSVAELNIPHLYSWADTERDLSAWCGNHLQDDALQSVYALRSLVEELKDPGLTSTWRSLLTSDHFYYMCTKWNADGDVHKYFNPYQDPYTAYINFQNVVKDLRLSLEAKKESHYLSKIHCVASVSEYPV